VIIVVVVFVVNGRTRFTAVTPAPGYTRQVEDDDITRSGLVVGGLAGPRAGAYTLIREIGSGGMGTVYLAVRHDDAFEKRVAIKILKRGMDSDSIVRRFRNERQILASLQHPYIAGLLDGGTTAEGLPYFAMEYIEGQRIVDYCDAHRLDTSARIELFRKVCAAVQYAHQNLIIHRDIKPANVLVTPDGTPKLLDFGIAKLLNPELAGDTIAPTAAGPQLMTPEYASPEQVRGEPVTTSTDVYSLGVLLYELLTGRRPYRLTSRTPAEIARVVCNSVPVPPSTAVTRTAEAAPVNEPETGTAPPTSDADATRSEDTDRLRRRLAGDLDTIVLKALSKDALRRYASVDQFSEDLRRHLAGLPVIARKDTLGYRTAKFVRRNRGAVAAAIVLFLSLVAGIVGTTWQASEARRERARAEQRFNDVRSLAHAFIFDLHDSIRDLPGSTPARQLLVSKGLEYLDKLARDSGGSPDLQRELAAAYLRVGDVQGRPLNPNLGDSAGALASYRKSVAIYEALTAGGVSDPAVRRELGTGYVRLSEIQASMGETGDALTLARKGLALQKETIDGTASHGAVSPEVRRELAATYSRVGDLLSATGDTPEALEHRRLALAIMQTLAGTAPDDLANIRQLGVAYQKLGNTLGNPNYPNVGDLPGALENLEKAHAIFSSATKAHPSNAMVRRNLAVINSNTADVLSAMNRSGDALARQREAEAAFKALADADPSNVAARNDVAISLSKIAEMLDATGRSREAIVEYQRALEIHQSLAAADPENDTAALEVASDHNRLATAQAKLGMRAVSLANHDRAVAMSQALRSANPKNVELTVAVALARLGRGDAYAAFGRNAGGAARLTDLQRAERDYLDGIELLARLQQEKAIDGTDVKTLENARAELARIRADLSRRP
jgi:non-specific serine/threonine protein kinase/serine/threonine-protein kinase